MKEGTLQPTCPGCRRRAGKGERTVWTVGGKKAGELRSRRYVGRKFTVSTSSVKSRISPEDCQQREQVFNKIFKISYCETLVQKCLKRTFAI